MTSKLKTDVLETVSGSGTIALTNQLSGMTHASVPAGSLLKTSSFVYPAANFVGDTTSASFINMGGSLSYTVVNTGSALRITHRFTLAGSVATSYWRYARVLIDGVSYGMDAAQHSQDNLYLPVTIDQYIDSLSLTAGQVIVIQLQAKSGSTTHNTRIYQSNHTPSLVIQEIKG